MTEYEHKAHVITVSVECEDAVFIGKLVSTMPEWLQDMLADGKATKGKEGVYIKSGDNGYHYAPTGSLLVRMKGPFGFTYQVMYNVVEVRR